MARTAVIAGTATAVSGGMRNRQQAGAQQQAAEQQAAADSNAQLADMQAQMSALQAQQTVPAAPANDLMSQLTQLGQLKSAGVLDQAEFTAAKTKLLGL
ncbi:SHOCT domain-containing protein [Arthrobacter sp. H35-D1]|uniref:SHOCT domain-containing protein n=1 Tax=Arthrobacter sp. H35-D1 TaxID=3046202 RepID=UPI0024B97A13|nr:SHOCT domain-containing protein [Arthrobacter sp. H35-D1]MDJ0315537.1 SHOCT domain-containing protein [Arthrobacter sp. H35-D1]